MKPPIKLTVKTFAIAFASISMLTLSGCTKDNLTPNQRQTSVQNQSNAAAVVFNSNQSLEIGLFVFIPCANGGSGDIAALQGPLHIQSHMTMNGNQMQIKQTFNPQGITGAGLTGVKYHATGETEFEQSGKFVNGQAVFTFVNNFNMIGQGPGNNSVVHETIHTTVNADGTVTSTVDNLHTDCK